MRDVRARHRPTGRAALVTVIVVVSWFMPGQMGRIHAAPPPAPASIASHAAPAAAPVGPACLSPCTASALGQLSLPGSTVTWIDMRMPPISLVPAVPCNAVILASADLFTTQAGHNQDLGIAVTGGGYRSGQPVAWQENSGAAANAPQTVVVHTVLPLAAHTLYTVKLQWKVGSPMSGAITTGPGTPPQLTVICRYRSSIFSTASKGPVSLGGSAVKNWTDIDARQLALSIRPSANCTALVLGTADLSAAQPGIGQDLGIWARSSDGSVNGIQTWKESAGAATPAPHAMLVDATFPVAAGVSYTIKLQWKSSSPTTRAITAAAGARLSMLCVPGSFLQSARLALPPPSSAATTWTPLDARHLVLSLSPTADGYALLTGSADLWSSQAGGKQDLGLAVSPRSYTGGQPAAWQENSGSRARAANETVVQTVVPVRANAAYTITLVWKRGASAGGAIGAGAGPLSGPISPTRLTALFVPSEHAFPPDPTSIAPPVNPTVPTTVAGATQFLYTGSAPIQTGVHPGTINPIRAAVLRGKVTDQAGEPLPGVTVTVLGHAELGQTLTRADGQFDLAVNGGGLFTVSYAKTGYLPVQRQVQSSWNDYAALPDVVMVPLDSQVIPVTLSASTSAMQVAQGSVQTDGDGSRQATLLFQPGTTAVMTMPDGSKRPLPAGHVRVTEYTVGSTGQESMPGTLPPTEGYSYAADFSFDEARQAGATSVQFDPQHPVISYTQDFLKWPVGLQVPSMYFDRSKGLWVEGAKGIVLQILSVMNGLANLDVDGSGQQASPATLSSLGISPAEQQALARLYPVGQKLWRVPLNHFTDFDY